MTSPSKYFVYKDGGYHKCNYLLGRHQINALVRSFTKPTEYFGSIQDYEESECVGSTGYFDIDNDDLIEAQESTIELVDRLMIEFDMDLPPLLSFSGRKGFHVILPNYIAHKEPHKIMFQLAKDIDVENVDYAVYGSRRLFRMIGSYNRKGGMYKIPISYDDLTGNIGDILDNAARRTMKGRISGHVKIEYWNEIVHHYSTKAKSHIKHVNIVDHGTDWKRFIPPCVNHLLEHEVARGEVHNTYFIIARYMRNYIEKDNLKALLSSHGHDNDILDRLLVNTYKYPSTGVNCESDNVSSLLMKRHCEPLCPYNREVDRLCKLN